MESGRGREEEQRRLGWIVEEEAGQRCRDELNIYRRQGLRSISLLEGNIEGRI